MGRINRANLKKTIYYLKRNGLKRTWYAVRERLEERKQPPYTWMPPSEAELAEQRRQWEAKGFSVRFSILVPAYRTKTQYLEELIGSLRSQTYPKWELILADATEDDSVEQAVRSILHPRECGGVAGGADLAADHVGCSPGAYDPVSVCSIHGPGGESTEFSDAGIRYIHLDKNAGIAENTNQALSCAAGDYVGLLDHDDVLTEDALYEMAAAIEAGRERGYMPGMLYSDEDKCNGDRTEYYEPNFKEEFNLDLLLSNNYICHFLVTERALMQKLKLRHEFDGAQDYDLVLRAAAELGVTQRAAANPAAKKSTTGGEAIIHIPKVLYHWRCHTGSTAENPQSKRYAYDAGLRAVQDFVDQAGWRAAAEDTVHVGFYRLRYEGSLFDSRPDVGAVGGSVVGRRHRASHPPGYGMRILGGRMAEDGSIFYENLPINYSGYLHRAILPQDAYAVDIRNIRVRPECRELFRQVTGVPYQTLPGTDIFDVSVLPEGSDIRRISLEFGRAMRDAGYRIVYLPAERRRLETGAML